MHCAQCTAHGALRAGVGACAVPARPDRSASRGSFGRPQSASTWRGAAELATSPATKNGHTTHTVGVRPCHRARLWARTWRRSESCASARASASAAEPQDGPSTVLSRELEQATGSFGNADASFFAQWVDVGGGGGGGGGNDCGDGNDEGGGGGEGGSAESTRASTGLSFALGVTLDVVCSRTRSSADSRAIHTAQHTSAKMLHRGSVSRCLGLASRGLASISPSCRRAERAWRVVLARRPGGHSADKTTGLIWGVCGHIVAKCRLEVPFSLCALARDADQTFTAPQHKLASLRLGCVRVSRLCPVLKLEAYEDHDRPHEEHGREVG